MNALDSKIAIDAVLAAAHAMLPQIDDYEKFAADRTTALVGLTELRSEFVKIQSTVAQARSEVEYAQTQLQRVKDETKWALADLGKLRHELDELERAKRRRG